MKHLFALPLRPLHLVTFLLLLYILLPSCHTRETSLGEARQLLRPTDERNRTSLEVVEESLAFIEKLEGPVAVVSIVGPYHTGKSFLLNQVVRSIAIAAGGSEGDDAAVGMGDGWKERREDESLVSLDAGQEVFQVGRNVNPETSGVWMYHKSLLLPPPPLLPSSSSPTSDGEHRTQHLHEEHLHEEQAPRRVDILFLDTEGFSVSNVTESYDAKVFAASTLLSSLLLYNSMHVLHANELEYLDLLVHNTQLFSIKTALKQQEEEGKARGKEGRRGALLGRVSFSSSSTRGMADDSSASSSLSELLSLPPLLMTVQAFTMNLAEGDADCTSWLSRLLSAPVRSSMGRDTSPPSSLPSSTSTSSSSSSSLQHMAIGTLFPSVSCQTLFLPATTRGHLTNLSSLPPSAMTKDFLRDLSSLDTSILTHLQPKHWSTTTTTTSSSSSSTSTSTSSTSSSSSSSTSSSSSSSGLSGLAFASLVRLVIDSLSSGELNDIPGRWELYERHLTTSSIRAALSGFDQELKRLQQLQQQLQLQQQQLQQQQHEEGQQVEGLETDTLPRSLPRPRPRPLTSSELHRAVAAASRYAHSLLQKLLVGLPRSLALASVDAEKGVAAAAAAAAAEQQEKVRLFLKEVGEEVGKEEREAGVWLMRGSTGGREGGREGGWPMPRQALEGWLATREKEAMASFERATGVFKERKGEGLYAQAEREVGEKLKARGNELRLANGRALELFLEGARKEALARYEEEMEEGGRKGEAKEVGKVEEAETVFLPPGVFLPKNVQLRHAQAETRMLTRFAETTKTFQGEKQLPLHVTTLKADADLARARLEKRNSARLRALCGEVKEELVLGVERGIGRLGEILDEETLEERLKEARLITIKGGREGGKEEVGVEEAFTQRVGRAVRATEEGKAVARALVEEVEALQAQVRKGLAVKLQSVLEDPLTEVCQKIIEARCAGKAYTSVGRFRKDVHRECGYYVRKHEVGRKLSKRMVASVIDQFIDTQLRPCREAVGREERRLRFWRKVTWGVGGVLALLAYARYSDKGHGGGGFLQRPQERRELGGRLPLELPPGGRPPPYNPFAVGR